MYKPTFYALYLEIEHSFKCHDYLCSSELQFNYRTWIIHTTLQCPQTYMSLFLICTTVVSRSVVGNTEDVDFVILKEIVDMFVKSKQKQILRENQLTPSNSSMALRAGLRTSTKQVVDSSRKDQLTALRTFIQNGNKESIPLLPPSLLCDLSVHDIKALLRLFNKPVGGVKKVIIERATSIFTCVPLNPGK